MIEKCIFFGLIYYFIISLLLFNFVMLVKSSITGVQESTHLGTFNLLFVHVCVCGGGVWERGVSHEKPHEVYGFIHTFCRELP